VANFLGWGGETNVTYRRGKTRVGDADQKQREYSNHISKDGSRNERMVGVEINARIGRNMKRQENVHVTGRAGKASETKSVGH